MQSIYRAEKSQIDLFKIILIPKKKNIKTLTGKFPTF